MIGRQKASEIADEQVVHAVSVEIVKGEVRRVRQGRDHVEAPARIGKLSSQQHPEPHVGGDELQRPVAVEIERANVRDCRAGRRVLRRERADCEVATVGVGARRRRGKLLRRGCQIEPKHPLHVRRQ